ncbi:hypothetical protein, partial [Shigella flexneri]|uniref:hypothetical protein n=1 Tax=Shigella flexneri TaxID=623 RepID=UPI001C0A8EFB
MKDEKGIRRKKGWRRKGKREMRKKKGKERRRVKRDGSEKRRESRGNCEVGRKITKKSGKSGVKRC